MFYAGIAVMVLIVAAILFISTRPEMFRIERSATVRAPADVAFSIVNDLHQWSRWSPFEKLDPNMKKSFEGSATGPGAISTWSGNNKAGEGRMTILDSKLAEFISIKLEFFRPFKATNQVTFQFAPVEGGTRVSWIMEGKNNFVGKAFHLLCDMDKMLGKDFDEGLANLNNVAQSETQKPR